RKTVSRRLVEAKNTTAMLTTFNEVDMSRVMELRTKYKETFNKKHGVNLGFMSFFTKAVCFALQEWPAVNAYIDGDEIVYHDYCDISIAVSAPKGLVVPVIRNAEHLNTNYAISKYRAEMEVWRGMGEGLSTLIVNPSTILGFGEWNHSSCALFKNVYNEFPWYTKG